MKTFWKPFAVLVTALKSKPFEWARLRLTLYYLVIMAVILSAFSVFLYFSLTKNIIDNLENNTNTSDNQVVSRTTGQIKTTILSVDGVILILTAGLSYALAGQTLRPIKLALDAQTQFTADASHEFRTPLSIIKYNGDVALKDPHLGLAEAKEAIHSGVEEAEHMSVIVDRLLMLARNENGWNDLTMTAVDLKNTVKNVVRNVRGLAEKKNLSLTVPRLDSALILGDKNALREMILNLLQNAIDYTASDGFITVSLVQKERFAELTVTDTGIGIEPKDLPHIFERFYKSDKARAMKQGGGLGLSIVKDIVQKHKGVIEIKSVPAQGTTVLVNFSLA